MKDYRRRVMLGMGQDPKTLNLDEEPIGYDGFGAPLYAHQIDSQGTE